MVFYAGRGKAATSGHITLKLYDGQTWRWVRLRVGGRAAPADWQAGSPQALQHGERWWLHVPLSRTFPRPKQGASQLAADPTSLLCAVDLNSKAARAVCPIQRADGTVIACRFRSGGDELHGRRKVLLGRIARKRRLTGVIAEGEQDNGARWAKVRHRHHDTAHRLSRRSVDFAQAAGAVIRVFEHLGPFRPERGKDSRRANAKRSSWLRGKLIHFARYQAWNAGLRTCWVTPQNTSRLCARCGAEVVRYAVGQPREGDQPGAPLVWCPRCQQTVHADFNASRAIGQRLGARCTPSPQAKPPTRLATGETPQGAGVRPSHAAAGPGSANRHGTA